MNTRQTDAAEPMEFETGVGILPEAIDLTGMLLILTASYSYKGTSCLPAVHSTHCWSVAHCFEHRLQAMLQGKTAVLHSTHHACLAVNDVQHIARHVMVMTHISSGPLHPVVTAAVCNKAPPLISRNIRNY